MPRSAVKTNKLSIYMIKPQFQRLEEIVNTTSDPVEIEGVGHFFYERSAPRAPAWLRSFFGSTLDSIDGILSSSAKGVLVVPVRDGDGTVHSALPFGVGRHLLRDDVTEERFGLKVVLNSVDPESLRSIDKTTLGTVPKHSREQMSREVNASEFGIDVDQDLLTAVTAKSLDERLGKMPSGKDALSLNVQVCADGIVDLLQHCLARYRSDEYKKTFGWIDQIAEVRDREKIAALKARLAEKLVAGDLTKIWMAVPEVVDWEDVQGFRYFTPKRGELLNDIGMESFLHRVDDRPITAEMLEDEMVYMISTRTGEWSSRWTAYRCTYAEIEHDGKLYILNNGQWYEIDKDFTDSVLAGYHSLPRSTTVLPDYAQATEGAYNRAVATSLGLCCMDNDPIVHGGGRSKIEFCDLLTPDKKIIHVKRYGGSSPLSHLFAQGVVSGELFASDAEFRRKVNDRLPDAYKLANPDTRPKAGEYEVVYAIISHSDADLDIPFFSKVSLKNARSRLEFCGYNVSLKKVGKVKPMRVAAAVAAEVPSVAT